LGLPVTRLPPLPSNTGLAVTIGGLAALLFILDLLTPRGLTEAVLYAAVVYLAARSRHRPLVLVVASGSTVLTVLGFVFSPPAIAGMDGWVSIGNRLFSISAIWVTALLALQRIEREQAIAHAESRISKQDRDRTAVLQSILDSMGDGVVVADKQGRFLLFNPAAEQILGIGPAFVDSSQWSATYGLFLPDMTTPYPPQDLPLSQAIRGEAIPPCELYVNNPQGAQGIWLSMSARPLKDDQGRVFGGVVVFRDITENKRLQEGLQQLAAIVESSEDGIIGKKLDGTIISWNAAAERIFGYTAEEITGRSISLLVPRDRQNEALQILSRVQRGIRITQFETERIRKDGLPLHVSLTISPIKDATGRITAASTIVRDMTARKQADELLGQTNDMLQERVMELERVTREITLLSEFGEFLQACDSSDEAFQVIIRFAKQLFPHDQGWLAMVGESRQVFETVAAWPTTEALGQVVGPGDCWALRRGRLHLLEDMASGTVCSHLGRTDPAASVCLPLVAQGETLGLLHLNRARDGVPGPINHQLASTVCEHLALALGNLKLREALQKLSVRDSLTGLFNRRYMEESLERELSRAQRTRRSLGVIMVDLDHFKRVNDRHGHDAGDVVLREVASFLQRTSRKGDIACRYGGEEFILILPEATKEGTLQRARQLRQAVKLLKFQHRGEPLGPISISAGVGLFPLHGKTGEEVLHQADAALYRAKAEGRDRVLLAD
ncbi:MAG: diguanylate cyclase, partial [Nitrospirales bacterium]